MITIELEVIGRTSQQTIALPVDEVLLAGYTGRDRSRVLEHIHELEKLGVAPPPQVPMVYVVSPDLLSTANWISVATERTSGEAEFYLMPSGDDVFVGVGSDHTDREHEAVDVAASKRMCPKVLSRGVWRYADIANHWDEIELASWVMVGEERLLYQRGTLADFLSFETLLDQVRSAGHPDLRRRVIFGGTLAVPGGFVYAEHFACQLYDRVLDRQLTCAYAVTVARG